MMGNVVLFLLLGTVIGIALLLLVVEYPQKKPNNYWMTGIHPSEVIENDIEPKQPFSPPIHNEPDDREIAL